MKKSYFILIAMFLANGASAFGESFEEYDIRVIRPRAFSKTYSFEIGLQAQAVTNQVFVNTFLGTFVAAFHFNNHIGLELNASLGSTSDKDEVKLLDSKFDVKTVVPRSKDFYDAIFLWTPMYGKFQFGPKKILYFDTVLQIGAGAAAVEYTFDQCQTTVSSKLAYYPQLVLGFGQRLYTGDSSSIKWDMKLRQFNANLSDGDCPGVKTSSQNLQQVLTFQLGYTYFI